MLEYVVPADQQRHSEGAPALRRPALARATVGGVDYAVGGWGEYEIARRRERWDASKRAGAGAPAGERPGGRYEGRRYIHADDAVHSVLEGARGAVGGVVRGTALRRAAERLAIALGQLEDRLCEPSEDGVWECRPPSALKAPSSHYFTVPALTSADLRAFAADAEQEEDPDALSDLGDAALSVAAAVGAVLPAIPSLSVAGLPPLPARAVPVADDEAVLRLEGAVAPYVTSVEGLQAALAVRLDAVATVVETALRRR